MYLTTSPRLLRWFMPRNLIWEIPKKERVLYFTFDDSPVAGVTDETLALLNKFNAKATFFCVGDNVRKHPKTFQRILAAGHTVGNHTFHHLNGWKTSTQDYVHDVQQCAKLVDSNLFRPPYGRITRRQASILSKLYRIIMWSVLSGDFDPAVTADQCFKNVVRSARPGSVIVMHNNEHSAQTMLSVLPKILEYFRNKGFGFAEL
ncbi:MAG TPA: polysaccharide deacetylase family protein [Bacteroidales bacterium]|mgnify:CR=1 FL=1|nr:polysaccharide deacetylase family protein [Bacteroidales bacterium]